MSKMSNVSYPFRKTEIANDNCSMEMYGKKDATWEQMSAWLEENYGDNGKDVHWKWRGFGTIGTEDFSVVVLRQRCSNWLCEAEETCDKCGSFSCELKENKAGDNLCLRYCYNEDSEDEEDEESDNDE
jgi:hypothetical protein